MFITQIDQQDAVLLARERGATTGTATGMAAEMARQIEVRGYAELTGLFTAEQVAEARAQAEAALSGAGGSYAGLSDTSEMQGAILRDLADSPELARVCHDLFAHMHTGGAAIPSIRFSQVFRCISGEPKRHVRYFHYDSYALTLIVPVAIPTSGQTGDLLLWPTARAIRRSYVFNMVEKFIADRRFVQHLLGRAARRSRSLVRLRLVPGNLYIFSGYRALHANEAVDEGALRATLVLHCIDPHENALSKRVIGRLRGALRGRRSFTMPATA